ncbi:hypothetical protein PM082_008640 [Marasmius tenuissimus]|nr:hypothetical protein PM082_008640 [Marasmius tenuissimus]
MYWRTLPPGERAEWEAKARIAQEEHRRRYPDWRFRPGSSKNNVSRGRGRRGKGGGRKGRLKTKDGGGEEDNSAEPDEVPVGVKKNITNHVDKGKGKERERDELTRVNGKGKAREVEQHISPQKISIMTPYVPPTLKRPYHLRDRPEKSSTTSPTAYEVPSSSSSSAPQSLTTTNNHNSSGSSKILTSSADSSSKGLGAGSSKERSPVATPSQGSNESISSSPKKTPSSGAKPHSEPQPTREDLRLKHITQLLVQGKEGEELEHELERWERGEEGLDPTGPSSSDTERGGAPPSWSPVASTPSSDWTNTPPSASATDTDTHTQGGEWNFSGIGSSSDRRGARQFFDPNAPTLADEDRNGNSRKRSSSAPAPRGRTPVLAQIPPHSESYADLPSTIDDSQIEDGHEEEPSTYSSTWDTSYDNFYNGYEQPQQHPSPYLSSLLSSDHVRGHDQNQRQWTYPPYSPSETQTIHVESSLNPHQYSTFRSRNPLQRHTRTRSHVNPIQTLTPSECNMTFSPTTSGPYSPQGSMVISPTHSVHSPITPSSAPPGFREVPQTQPDRVSSIPRRGSIAFPISPSASVPYSSPGSFSHHRSAGPQQFTTDNQEQSMVESGIQMSGNYSLTWDEPDRRQWYREREAEGAHSYTDEDRELDHTYPSPDTRNMGWMVPSHQQDPYQSFSPASDDAGHSNMGWEQAGEGRRGMVTCIVDPFLRGSEATQSDIEIASPVPPPASSYSSLTGWAGEPVIRISPPNIYDRRDKQSDIWETDGDVGFGYGVGFGRRGG